MGTATPLRRLPSADGSPRHQRATSASTVEAALGHIARLAVDEQHPLERVFALSTKLAARLLGVERVGIWLFEEGDTLLRCVSQYERSTGRHGAGELLHPADFPAYGDALDRHRLIVADDAHTHPWTRQLAPIYLEPHGITSMLDAPLLRHGKVRGVVCHEHVGPRRTWTDAERSCAASIADILAGAIEQAAWLEAQRTAAELRRRMEEERRMATLGRVVAAVAHDFGHLLSIVLGHVQLIRGVPGLDERVDGHARTIVEAIRHSRELTRQLADLGRDPGVPEPLGLDGAVGATAPLLASLPRRDQRIEIGLGAGEARMRLDRGRVERILLNLVVNALDATPEGGTVRVTTATLARADGEYAVLRVTDDGTGIAEAARPHIFEPYFTTKPDGGASGLGLAIVQTLVDRAGGFVTVDSEAGRGTTFAVHLPVARDEAGGAHHPRQTPRTTSRP